MPHVLFSFPFKFNDFPLSMDNMICVGCGRSFSTQKSLHSHEAYCKMSKALAADIHCHHRNHKKSKKQKCTKLPSYSPKLHDAAVHARFFTPDADFQLEVMYLILFIYL